MKPNYILILCLVILLGTASNSYSQVRILEVNKTTDVVTLKNFGSSAQNVSSWQFCSLFNYMPLSNLTIENGDLMLMPDNTVTLSGFTLADNEADLGLYENGSFSSPSAMRDFLQWGSAGNGRENVADSAGIWNAGNFLPDASSYQYTGNGTQTGLAFWTTLSLDDLENEIEVNITPNPVVQNLNIQQKNAQLLDVQVFNLQGQLAKRTFVENENTSIDFSALSSGVYFVKLIDALNNTFTQKIVKQ
jgi:hypothetical protein